MNILNNLKINRARIAPAVAICAAVLAILFASPGGVLQAASLEDSESAELSESKKIEMLIARVENSGGVFVRNGSEHSATAAAAHMRMKLSRAGGLIKTARHFIKHIATKSSITGRAYLIKFPDGREYKSAEWLRARLAEIESAATAEDECCSIKR